jgi:hypothetical protein
VHSDGLIGPFLVSGIHRGRTPRRKNEELESGRIFVKDDLQLDYIVAARLLFQELSLRYRGWTLALLILKHGMRLPA